MATLPNRAAVDAHTNAEAAGLEKQYPGKYSDKAAAERCGFVPPDPVLALRREVVERGRTTADHALALCELAAWIEKSPSERSVWTIEKHGGKWRLGLQSGDERFSASQDAELRGAIRNAIMIANFAGCL